MISYGKLASPIRLKRQQPSTKSQKKNFAWVPALPIRVNVARAAKAVPGTALQHWCRE